MSTFGREVDERAKARREQAKQAEAQSHLVVRCASEIELEHVEWLWPARLALGKHTCIAGDPGTGKSQLSPTMIAATVTMGGEWPCDEGRSSQGSVIILSAEDGAGDTIVPGCMQLTPTVAGCISLVRCKRLAARPRGAASIYKPT